MQQGCVFHYNNASFETPYILLYFPHIMYIRIHKKECINMQKVILLLNLLPFSRMEIDSWILYGNTKIRPICYRSIRDVTQELWHLGHQ